MGLGVFFNVLLYLLNFTIILQYFAEILDPRGGFQDPQNDSKTIPKLFQNYSKTIPKLIKSVSEIIPNDPETIPTCLYGPLCPQELLSSLIRGSEGVGRCVFLSAFSVVT